MAEPYSDPELFTQADLDAHIGAVLAKAADAGYVACAETRHVTLGQKVEAAILALRPTALTALDRAKREARVKVLEDALREAVKRGAAMADSVEYGLLGWSDAVTQWDNFCAALEGEK